MIRDYAEKSGPLTPRSNDCLRQSRRAALEICAIRVRLQLGHRDRGLALFNLAIDSKLEAAIS